MNSLYESWLLPAPSTWQQLHMQTATAIVTADLDGNGQADVLVNFGAAGLWEHANNAAWRRLHTLSPGEIAVGRIKTP